MKYKLAKVVLSLGLGNRGVNLIEKVRVHLSKILEPVLKNKENVQRITLTTCRKSNAKFKIRKGNVLGLKVTLRKKKINTLLELLKDRVNYQKVHYNNSTLFLGISDHRLLRLEKYDYEAPSYGFNLAFVFTPVSDRIYTRRINKIKRRKIVPKDACLDIFNAFK